MCGSVPRDLCITSDGGAVIWGRDKYFFVMKVDANGVPLWARHFGYHHPVLPSIGHKGSFQFVKELPNGDLVAGLNMDSAGAVVARLAPDGSFLWCNSYIPQGMVHDCLVEADGSIVVTAATDSIALTNTTVPLPSQYQPKLAMLKLNSNGDVLWCKGYYSSPNLWYTRSPSRIVRAQDGHYVVLASLGTEGYNRPLRPFMMKTNSNGDTLWTRSVGQEGTTYEPINLMAYSDGGFIYDGIAIGDGVPLGSGPFIFKTDSLGHLPCYERQHPITVMDLFPTDSSFTLSSTDGAVMYEIAVTDTTYAPIEVYENCALGQHWDSIRPTKPRLRPNPTTGRFTVEFQDPLMAESYYSVYDAVGKLLYQRPLRAGATVEEVDLARFGPGTYVITFTSQEGTCYERVVVE